MHHAIRRQMRIAYGYRNGKGRALSYLARDTDRPLMQPHQLTHHRQPDTRAFETTARAVLDPMETVEDLVELVFGDAHARIANAHHHMIAQLTHINGNGAVMTIFKGIGNQVEDDPLP